MTISVASRKAKARNQQNDLAERVSKLTGIPCGKDELICGRMMGQSGCDLILIGEAKRLFPFACEAKCCEFWSHGPFIKQASTNVKGFPYWLLVMKKNRMKSVVLMESKLFKILMKNNKRNPKIFTQHITRKNNWNLQSEIEHVRNKMKKKKGYWTIKCGNKMCYTVVSIDFFFELYGSSMMFKNLKG